MFDPVEYMWHWITSSTPFTGGWITVICLAAAIPLGLRQSINKWKRDHAAIKRRHEP